MRTVLLAVLLSVVCALTVQAQTSTPSPITEFQLLILPGTGDPATLTPLITQTTTIGATANCGIDPASITISSGPAVNPKLFVVDDPYTPGRVCRLSMPQSVPVGSYQWVGVFRAATCNPTGTQVLSPCPSQRSAAGPPFQVVNLTIPPAVPTGLRFLQ